MPLEREKSPAEDRASPASCGDKYPPGAGQAARGGTDTERLLRGGLRPQGKQYPRPGSLTAIRPTIVFRWKKEYPIVRASGANVAQLVEQRTRNAQVVGSIPTVGSIFVFPHRYFPA